MGEFVECVEGIGEACEYLNSWQFGNVSFYNQTKEGEIKPTPSGGVGWIRLY